jgi:AAA domain, putative AbiEii toxin, Type IV TA system
VLFDRASNEICNAAIAEFVDPQASFFAALRRAYFEKRVRLTGLVGHVSVNISRFGKFRLDPTILGRPGPLPETLAPAGVRLPPRRMGYLGEELASVLYFLSRTRDHSMDSIIEGVRSAIDGFAGFEFNAVGNDLVGFSARCDDSRGVVEAPNLSAGTLGLIGWLTLLRRGDRQPVVMLEEPELGLTPRSTKAIYDAMAAASTSTEPRTQLLVASHSPFILNWAGLDYGTDKVYVLSAREGAGEIATYESVLEQPGHGVKFDRAMGVEQANQVMHGF